MSAAIIILKDGKTERIYDKSDLANLIENYGGL